MDETTVVADAVETLVHAPAVIAKSWETEVEIWFSDLRQNMRELDTEVHNKLFAAKEALKAKLNAIL